MGLWEGLPVGSKLARMDRGRQRRQYAGCGLVIGLFAVFAFIAFVAGLSRGVVGEAQPTAGPTARTTGAMAPLASPTAVPTAAPTPSPVPSPQPRLLVVANTGGEGVFLRRTPSASDKVRAWPEKTAMVLVGEDTVVDGRRWQNVRDPSGNLGWIPAEYLAPAPATPQPLPTASRP